MSSSRDNNNALCLPCPVTGGVSTKMTKESFAKACKFARQAVQYSIYGRKKRNDNKILRERCAGCRGKRWPQELQITTVEDIIMSQFYTCDLCGKKISAKKPRKSLGMSLCYTCAGIVAGLQHMKELATALKKTGKTDELLKALGVEEKRYEDLEVVAMDAMEILAKALPPAPESVDDTMSAYEVATIAEEAAQHIASLKKQITDMHDLKDVVRDARGTLLKVLSAASDETLDDTQSLYDIATIAENVALYAQELKDKARMAATGGAPFGNGNDPLENALLRWAIQQYQAGRVKVSVEVTAE